MSRKIMIIDAMNSVFRSYAVDPTVNDKGEHIGALKGFLKQMQKMCREIKPDEIYVIWDGVGGSSRRRSMNKGYKEGRKAVDPARYNRHVDFNMSEEELQKNKAWQISRIAEYLNEMPVKQFVYENIEADDAIALLSKFDCLKDDYKIIISNDRDFYQLLDDKTIIYRAVTKRYMTKADVIAEEGVHPNNMTLVRAICGDKSDNLPGIKGVGIKTLVKNFPFLIEENRKYVDDLVEEIKSMENPSKVIQEIVYEKSTVIDNFRIMQLYNPVIKKEALEQLEELACYSEADMDWTKVQSMMIQDGFGTYNWTSLHDCFKSIISNNKEQTNE